MPFGAGTALRPEMPSAKYSTSSSPHRDITRSPRSECSTTLPSPRSDKHESARRSTTRLRGQRQEVAAREADASSAIASAKGAVEIRADKLTEVAKALATLSDPQSSADELRFLADFAKQVDAGIEAKKDDADTVAAKSVIGSQQKSVSQ